MQPGSEQRVGQPQPRNLIQEEGQGEAEDSILFSSLLLEDLHLDFIHLYPAMRKDI